MTRALRIAFAVGMLSGCHDIGLGRHTAGSPRTGDSSGEAPLDGLSSIDITPATAHVVVLNGTSAGVSFTATGHFADGHSADVTGAVSWTVQDPTLGQMMQANYDGSAVTRGGDTTVVANTSGITATAALFVKYQVVRVSGDNGSTAPSNAPDQFTAAMTDPAGAKPTIVYPLDQTRVPSNVNSLEVQWTAGGGSLYEVSIDHPSFGLKVYTNSALSLGGHYFLTPAEWTALTASVQDAPVLISVRCLVAGRVTASTPVRLDVAKQAIQGGIYYWANPGNTSRPYVPNDGIIRRDFGDPTAASTAFFTNANSNTVFGGGDHCVACHALSRDGKKIAVNFDFDATSSGVFDVATKAPILQVNLPFFHFASFSPDAKKLVAVLDHQTRLVILDVSGTAASGTVLQTIGTPGEFASHADWSADGKSIVYSSSAAPSQEWNFGVGSLKIATDDGTGTFSTITTLVPSQNGDNNYYPSFSPDGKWVLYNHAPAGGTSSNSTADIWIISADGMTGPVRLVAANAGMNLTNSWPRWTPFLQSYGKNAEPLYYFTFASKRDYGLELVGTGRSQIWMSSFNPADLSGGIDAQGGGSTAPFWLPFQDPMTSNHNALWVEAIVPVIN